MSKITKLNSFELAHKIRNRKISPVEAVESFIERIEKINPHLNAIVVNRFEDAIQQAEKTKNQIQNSDPEELPPLIGVPCTIKEMISVEGYPITCGSVKRQGVEATDDAQVVKNLKTAGAIPIGLSNVPELGLWIESSNYVYGRTNNPHDISRTAGGSSGGEAASIAARLSPFGIGSDMGGSIRIPSLFCGIFGHKPTTNDLSTDGHFPLDHSPVEPNHEVSAPYVSLGPMTRFAKDLAPLLEILRGKIPSLKHTDQLKNQADTFEDTTVHLLIDPDIKWVSQTKPAQQNAVRQVGDILSDRGANVTSWSHENLNRAMDIYTSFLEDENHPPTTHLAGTNEPLRIIPELLNFLAFRSQHTLPMLMLTLFEKVMAPGDDRVRHFLEEGESLQHDLDNLLGQNNLLIAPPYPSSAPEHGTTLMRPFDLAYSALFNVMDFPATSAPVGTNTSGLPLGVQIIAPRERDDLSISAAIAIDEETEQKSPINIH